MSFNWSEYLSLAQELAGRSTEPPNQEARLRSSISRAYYAAFCKARNYLLGKGHSVPRKNTHQYVIDKFRCDSDIVRKEIGENLNRLRIDRNKADYEDTVARPAAMTDMALKLAEGVILNLGRL